MTTVEKLLDYFNENEDDFNDCIEQLDSWNGYLNDNRYYPMEDLSEFYAGDIENLLNRVYFGHDEEDYTTDANGNKHYAEFCPLREYFTYNGYGNLVSSDTKDYSAYLDEDFCEQVIEYAGKLYLPDEVQEIVDGDDEEDEEE